MIPDISAIIGVTVRNNDSKFLLIFKKIQGRNENFSSNMFILLGMAIGALLGLLAYTLYWI